jgi:hypothetical protein
MIKCIRAAFAAFFVAGTIVAATPAAAVPLICVMPTSGTVSGLTLVQDINSCLGSALALFAGGTTPDSPTTGMLWWNTGTGYVAQWDGTGWNNLWNVDTTNHLNAVQIGGGVQASLASASITDLWSVPAASVAVTGTSTITQLANGHAVPGAVKIVTFAGALTLTQGGGTGGTPLNLPNNGSNIVTAPGDYAIVLALTSNNVQVIQYTRATGAALSTFGLNVGAAALGNSALSFDMPVNLGLTASIASNALTVSIVGANGATPSSTNPVLIPFRSTTPATGTPSVDTVTATAAMTVGSGFTMGCSSNVACRIWIYAIDNGGNVLLGLQTCSNATQTFSCSDDLLFNTNANTNGTNLNGVLASTVAGLAGKAVRIIGYLEATETTAGTWATAPSKIQIFGPGVKKPGDVVQNVAFSTASSASWSATSLVGSNLSGSITPTSTINPIRVKLVAGISASANSGGNEVIGTQVYRGISGTFNGIGQLYNTGFLSPGAGSTLDGIVTAMPTDLPGTTSLVTYTLYFNTGASGHTVTVINGEGELMEIMGALEEPGNDAGATDLPPRALAALQPDHARQRAVA